MTCMYLREHWCLGISGSFYFECFLGCVWGADGIFLSPTNLGLWWGMRRCILIQTRLFLKGLWRNFPLSWRKRGTRRISRLDLADGGFFLFAIVLRSFFRHTDRLCSFLVSFLMIDNALAWTWWILPFGYWWLPCLRRWMFQKLWMVMGILSSLLYNLIIRSSGVFLISDRPCNEPKSYIHLLLGCRTLSNAIWGRETRRRFPWSSRPRFFLVEFVISCVFCRVVGLGWVGWSVRIRNWNWKLGNWNSDWN